MKSIKIMPLAGKFKFWKFRRKLIVPEDNFNYLENFTRIEWGISIYSLCLVYDTDLWGCLSTSWTEWNKNAKNNKSQSNNGLRLYPTDDWIKHRIVQASQFLAFNVLSTSRWDYSLVKNSVTCVTLLVRHPFMLVVKIIFELTRSLLLRLNYRIMRNFKNSHLTLQSFSFKNRIYQDVNTTLALKFCSIEIYLFLRAKPNSIVEFLN